MDTLTSPRLVSPHHHIGHHLPHPSQLSPASLYRSDTPQPLSLKIEKPVVRSYGSPPPVAANHPDNNVCKMIEYRQAKVAAFIVDGRELICLPQAFDLFLKHLVGGLHTVYTKLKRLEITPVVCNVEQVRILRGLGAIQPGVNRCKLISCKEFDILYEDCTNSSARPGRPPKRSPMMNTTQETLEKIKKSRMDSDYLYGANRLLDYFSGGSDKSHSALAAGGYHHYPPHLGMLPFMPMSYPAMTSATGMVMGNPHLGLRALDATVLKERNGDEVDSISPRSNPDHHRIEHRDSRDDKPQYPRPAHYDVEHARRDVEMNGSAHDRESGISTASDMSMNGPLDYKKYTLPPTTHVPVSQDHDTSFDDNNNTDGDDEDSEQNDSNYQTSSAEKFSEVAAKFSQNPLSHELTGPSSLEALLLNIQGLLKVAAEHAKQKERQAQYEHAELKVELMRERERNAIIEKQIKEEQQIRETFERRWRKEKKARRMLEERIDSPTISTRPISPLHQSEKDRDSDFEPSRRLTSSPEGPRNFNVYADHVSVGPFVSGTSQTSLVNHASTQLSQQSQHPNTTVSGHSTSISTSIST